MRKIKRIGMVFLLMCGILLTVGTANALTFDIETERVSDFLRPKYSQPLSSFSMQAANDVYTFDDSVLLEKGFSNFTFIENGSLGRKYKNSGIEHLLQLQASTNAMICSGPVTINGQQKNMIVISIAGTKTNNPLDLDEWIRDFHAVEIDRAGIMPIVKPVEVHPGFAQNALALCDAESNILITRLSGETITLREAVTDALMPKSEFFLLITGHSLGAATAQIYGKTLYDRGVYDFNFAVYTFATPKPFGTNVFLEADVIRSYPFYNVLNTEDVITKVGANAIASFRYGEDIQFTPNTAFKEKNYTYRDIEQIFLGDAATISDLSNLFLSILPGTAQYRYIYNAHCQRTYQAIADTYLANTAVAGTGGNAVLPTSTPSSDSFSPISLSITPQRGNYADVLPQINGMENASAQASGNEAIRAFEEYIWLSRGQYGGEDPMSDIPVPSKLFCSGVVRIGNILDTTFRLEIGGWASGPVFYSILIDLRDGSAISAKSLYSDWQSAYGVIFDAIYSQHMEEIGYPDESYLPRSEIERAIRETTHTYALDYDAIYAFSDQDYLFDATSVVTRIPLSLLYPYFDSDAPLGFYTQDRFEHFSVVWP